jgi:hypothetical protein
VITFAKRVSSRAKQFREWALPKKWKTEHDAAMAEFDLEHWIAVGIVLWDYFGQVHDAWMESVETGKAPYEAFVERTFDRAERSWLDTALALERSARAYEKKGRKFERIDEFRDRINSALFMLADVEELHRKNPALEQARRRALANAKARREGSKKS